MANLKDFIMSNVDIVLVVNKDFEIIYSSRFDDRIGNTDENMPEYKKEKNLFEMYPTLGRNNSSIAKTLATGEVVINDVQEFVDLNGKVYVTQNITFPVFQNGQIVGVVELTKDLTTMKDIEGNKKEQKTKKLSYKNAAGSTTTFTFDDILTNDSEMKRAIEQAKLYSRHMNPTLIYGETGTGKELFVQAMIDRFVAPREKIVVQNCAAVPDNLIESILFGTTSGSYTGAENKNGLFDEADGGVIFLDELNSLSYDVQGKLLRVVQDGTFRPIGSNVEKKVDVKIIAAMNVDPMDAIESKVLRKDLFYRLSSSMIFLPPLRERKVDIELFLNHYLKEFNKIYGKKVEGITDELRELFLAYTWEGNVRELKHVIESMVCMAKDSVLSANEIPLYLHNKIKKYKEIDKLSEGQKKAVNDSVKISMNGMNDDTCINLNEDSFDLKDTLEEMEKNLIIKTLKKVKGNKTKAGKLLNIPRQTLTYKMGKLGIDDMEK